MDRFGVVLLTILSVATVIFALSPNREPDEDNTSGVGEEYFQPVASTSNCICVPFDQCKDSAMVSDGSGVVGPREKPQSEKLLLNEKYLPPACGPYHVCCRDPEVRTVKPYKHRCGNRNFGGINGGIFLENHEGEAEFGEWPWQVAILRREGNEYTLECGGTLIDENHIITVAHRAEKFLDNIGNMVVRLGEWETQHLDEFLPHEDYNVTDIVLHPLYCDQNLYNDIAVITLASEVNFKPHIDTACLPFDEDDFVGHECVVTGWGSNAFMTGKYSVILKGVTVNVISNEDCQEKLRETRVGRFFELHSGFLCAGGEEDKDSCTGDGGGPLVCHKEDNRYTVVGLVSWGINCGKGGVPGVYVNVKKYIDWISSVTGKPITEYWT